MAKKPQKGGKKKAASAKEPTLLSEAPPSEVPASPSVAADDDDQLELVEPVEPVEALPAAIKQLHIADENPPQEKPEPSVNGTGAQHQAPDSATTSEELEALRETLRALQTDRDNIVERCASLQSERDAAQEQYSELRVKVTKITAQLSTRITNYENTITESNSRIEELEGDKAQLEVTLSDYERQMSTIRLEKSQLTTEVDLLRSRGELANNNWSKERDDHVMQINKLREDLLLADQARQDWEVLAMEERAEREALSDRADELEEQLQTQQQQLQRAQQDAEANNQTISDLQRALSEVQNAHQTEIQDRVVQSEEQVVDYKRRLASAEQEIETKSKELEKALTEAAEKASLERELKERRLQIGKLRHEAVILNEHLVKALRFLKQRKPEEMVDREIVTNHFLQFVTLDRSDPKKFQVLQLIAALLSWSDEQKEQAGLSRPGTSFSTHPRAGSVQSPSQSSSLLSSITMPFRRPSHNSLAETASMSVSTHPPSPGFLKTPTISHSKESLAELWTAFLEREATETVSTPTSGPGPSASSRAPSEASQSISNTPARHQGGNGGVKT